MASSLLIENILSAHKITDYLASKGIHPDGGERGGKLFYRCPLHEGDNTPSFVVYTGSAEYENFYCFGCKARYNIIHLFRDLEKCTLGHAIRMLGKGMEVDDEAEMAHAINIINNDKSVENEYTPDELVLLCSRSLYEFQKQVDNDPDCLQSVEKMFRIIDKAAGECDLKNLKKIYDTLPEVLYKRLVALQEQKESQMMETMKDDNAQN